MHKDFHLRPLPRLLPRVCAALGAALLSACGGSDDAPVTTRGVVVGSYFQGAKVCLDSNVNGVCDSSEAATTSDANGGYTLSGSGSPVVAEIGTDAKRYDPATGSRTTVVSRIVLRAPKEAPGVLSLHSTSVVAEMERNGLSYGDAVKKVALAVGVAGDKLLTDFNTETDTVTRAALKNASDDGLARIASALAAGATDVKEALATAAAVDRYYQTKAPYRPQQDLSTYEAAPAGYTPVYSQLLARHGSRGLSSLKYDLAIYNMWKKAQDDGALTDLGARLGPDVLKIMKANFLLGYGVNGISTPGYGNETQVGIDEHTQLAVRFLKRQSAYWTQVGSTAATAPRSIVTVTSGVDRAVDSGAFFVKSLKASQPNLAALVSYPPAPSPYPDSGKAVAQADGTNRFLLYFHKLVKATDLVSKTSDPLYTTYQDSQAYQTYKASDADLLAKQSGLLATDAAKAAGRAVLEKLFAKSFVDKLDNGTYSFANTGSFTYSSDDGKFTSTLSGDGKTPINSLATAGSLLYELYVIAPALRSEAGVDFTRYMPVAQAQYFAYLNDASDFYDKGPGMTEKGDITYRMAQILVDDFFNEVDAIAHGDLSHAAKLRFAHAEIAIPFASRMGLKKVLQQVPKASTYTYDNNVWRGEYVSPMAANMQWDVYRHSSGKLLVKMLYNEKETEFKADCDSARVATGSFFYDYDKLKTCYGHVAAN